MINTACIFAEFVNELGEDYILDAINENGIAFYHRNRRDLKFSIVMSPMFGLAAGYVGFVVTKNKFPYKDEHYRFEDPTLLDKIKDRIEAWLTNAPEIFG